MWHLGDSFDPFIPVSRGKNVVADLKKKKKKS